MSKMQSLTAKLSRWTKKVGRPFSYSKASTWGQERLPIVFYAFDLLRLNGKNLQILPIEERKAKLEDLLKKPPGVIRYSVSFTKDIEELLSRTRRFGLEGLIGKRNGSRYEVGNGAEPGSSSSSTTNRNSSSAETPNRTGLGSIWCAAGGRQ